MAQVTIGRYEIKQNGDEFVIRDTVEDTTTTITKGELAAGIASGAVGLDELADASVSNAKIQQDAVERGEIASSSVGRDEVDREERLPKTGLDAVMPQGSRITSATQSKQGVFTSIPHVPTDTVANGGACVKHPTEDGIVSIGGYNRNGVAFYDLNYDTWDTTRFPDLYEDIGNLAEGDGIESRPAVGAVGDWILVTAFSTSNSNYNGNEVFGLDTSQSDPSWQVLSHSLPMHQGSPSDLESHGGSAFTVHDGWLYVWVGDFDDQYNISARVNESTAEQIQEFSGKVHDAARAPVYDGYAYLHGLMGYTKLQGARTSVRYRYEFSSDNYEQIPPEFAMQYPSTNNPSDATRVSKRGSGRAAGMVVPGQDVLMFVDGYQYFRLADVAYYSPSENQWVGYPYPPVDLSRFTFMPWMGAKSGVEFNGLLYTPAVGIGAEYFPVYKPHDRPFDVEVDRASAQLSPVGDQYTVHWDGGERRVAVTANIDRNDVLQVWFPEISSSDQGLTGNGQILAGDGDLGTFEFDAELDTSFLDDPLTFTETADVVEKSVYEAADGSDTISTTTGSTVDTSSYTVAPDGTETDRGSSAFTVEVLANGSFGGTIDLDADTMTIDSSSGASGTYIVGLEYNGAIGDVLTVEVSE